ncbi:MAG: hypothetical protein JO307_21820 [Bryobacterales bacterium]|nr:hypothetical protein [Bryobacterales bacterium]
MKRFVPPRRVLQETLALAKRYGYFAANMRELAEEQAAGPTFAKRSLAADGGPYPLDDAPDLPIHQGTLGLEI